MNSQNRDGDAVVVPAIRSGSALASIRSLGRRGVRVIAVHEREDVPPFRSKYCDETRIVPAPAENLAGYRDALLALARRPDVRTIVPVREPDVYVLSKHREAFAEHVGTPWPSRETVRETQDRRRLFEIAASVGVSVPRTRPLDEVESWNGNRIIKSRYSTLIDDNRASYADVEFVDPNDPPDTEAVTSRMGHVPMIQEYIPGGEECGFFAIFDEGEPLATFQHRRIRSFTYSGGASAFRESIALGDLDAAGLALLAELDWHGPAMVEFKRDERDGELKLMEINPRFWGSLPLAICAGVDFPALYYRLAIGDPPEPVNEYDVGVGCHVLRGEASYLHSVARYDFEYVERPSLLGETAAVVHSCFEEPRFDYLSLDDPEPIVRDLWNTAGLVGERVSARTRRLAAGQPVGR